MCIRDSYRAGWTDVKDYTGKVHYPGKLIADEDLKHLKGELYDKFSDVYKRQPMSRRFS